VTLSAHLRQLESESIHIIRDGVAEADNPVVLFSAGKDSTVLAHLVMRAFWPAKPPLPLLHVDATWEFKELEDFRDKFAAEHGFKLDIYANEEGRAEGLNPIDHGDRYTTVMRTGALKQALTKGKYDVIFGGARRDEEATRAKERIVSVRDKNHGWEPRKQRPELWDNYNWRKQPGESLRVYPISNWTEHDIWAYIVARNLELAPLYYAKEREIVDTEGGLIVMEDPDRLPALAGLPRRREVVRFRSLGCWPVTTSIKSEAADNEAVYAETIGSATSERMGRVSDAGSLEAQKRQGYF